MDRGELLRNAVKISGRKRTDIARLAGYAISTYYTHINNVDLPLDVLIRYGKALKYDFSQDIPEIATLAKFMGDEDIPTTLEQALIKISLLEKRNKQLLEKYNLALEELNSLKSKK